MENVDEILVVKPHGRLTIREGHDLLEAIFAEVGPRPRDVVVDLSSVSDMSSWGFALVCGLARQLARMGQVLRIAGPSAFVRKYLEIFTGLKQPMQFHRDRDEAVRQARLGRHRQGGGRGF